MNKNKIGGFSLLELIVVIAIMAVLGGIVIGNSNYSKSAQVKKYTELTDGFMRKARTEIMSKNTVSGVCLYEKEGRYYIESYKEKENGGTVTFETVKREKLGKPHGVEISAATQDGTGEKTLRDNAGDSLSTFIRIGYDRSTGAVSKFCVNTEDTSELTYTKITFKKGENSKCIEINPAT
mgnify:FL=1